MIRWIAGAGRAAAAGLLVLAALPLAAAQPPGQALQQIVLGVQPTGTASWELEVIKSRELDHKHGIELVIREVADSRAGTVALQAGEVDIVLSDFFWVSLQRAKGTEVSFVPHSLTVGGVITKPDSGIAGVADLKGRRVGVAGGPLDKSWLVLQAYYAEKTGGSLADEATVRFGAPPLVNELIEQGEIDVALNVWHFNTRLKAKGMVEILSVPAMLSEMQVPPEVPLLGWVFRDSLAAERPDALKGFLDASFAAKKILLESDRVWEKLREKMRAKDDEALFVSLRDDYRKGIVTSYGPKTVEAAAAAFALMGKIGGEELVGDKAELAPGTFWQAYMN
jgi:NitT/TauT family transport system substrate-binding protein